MTQVLVHRGPDDEGYYVDDHVGLGSRRLSIIDLAGGHQPVRDETGRFWIVLNGEVFNYQALREETERAGHRYYTNSDTEVVVHLYEEHGPAALDRLNGMFALAIWDGDRKELFLARDRIGVKPLYYAASGTSLYFASETKALFQGDVEPRLDLASLPSYLAFRAAPGDRTLFAGVRTLLPGHYLMWRDGDYGIHEWWDVPGAAGPMDRVGAPERLRALLEDATRLAMVSDVPVGMFLSGGVDSSAVTGLMATRASGPVRTYSVGFEEVGYNELPFARAVAEMHGTDHREVIFTQKDLLANLPRAAWHFDEPINAGASVAQLLLAQEARKEVSVVLTGHGGDELFAGYDTLHSLQAGGYDFHSRRRRFVENWLSRGINALPLSRRQRSEMLHHFASEGVSYVIETSGIKEGVRSRLYSAILRAQLNGIVVDEDLRRHFRRAPYRDPLNRVLYAMVKTLLPGFLLSQDKMTMAASVESRVPLLDHRVVEFAAQCPPEMKIRQGEGKFLLKRATTDVLPESVLTRRKMGFCAPEREWFRGELGEVAAGLIMERESACGIYFDRDYIRAKLSRHRYVDNSYFLWSMFAFEVWHRTFLRRPRVEPIRL